MTEEKRRNIGNCGGSGGCLCSDIMLQRGQQELKWMMGDYANIDGTGKHCNKLIPTSLSSLQKDNCNTIKIQTKQNIHTHNNKVFAIQVHNPEKTTSLTKWIMEQTLRSCGW